MDTTLRYPVVLTIAGSDSSGGAGIQADIKTFSALGVFGASAITSVTAQNTEGIRSLQTISPQILQDQIEAVFDDMTVDAVKIGMLPDRKSVEIVAKAIHKYAPSNIVFDPVMISTSGRKLMDDSAIDTLVHELLSRITLITPNTDEAAFLSGYPIRAAQDMEQAAQKLFTMGCRAVLIKGGHLPGAEKTDILFVPGRTPLRLTASSIDSSNTHGTGCTLSSAIAAELALGKELSVAVQLAKEYITSSLYAGKDVTTGHGHGPLNHFFSPLPLIKIQAGK